MNKQLFCQTCGSRYRPKIGRNTCDCGGMLSLPINPPLSRDLRILNREWSIFRYTAYLPFEDRRDWQKISLGEGMTPLRPIDGQRSRHLVKCEYAMPTLSFKDRGAVVLVAKASALGATQIVQDSSGNAGTAVAAYAARAGISCDIYVPASTSEKKIQQIMAHGANVHRIEGTREDTARAAREAASVPGVYYASHVYNPYFYEGTKTYVYEIYEQMNGHLPDVFWTPVGNGTLLLGIYRAFTELKRMGLIEDYPKIYAVQSEGCAPLYDAFHQTQTNRRDTLAEGIAIADPKRKDQILEALRETEGTIYLAKESEIPQARRWMARRGYYVETTSAATIAAYLEVAPSQELMHVIPLCGAGIKSGVTE